MHGLALSEFATGGDLSGHTLSTYGVEIELAHGVSFGVGVESGGFGIGSLRSDRRLLAHDLPLDFGVELLASDDQRVVSALQRLGAGCSFDCRAVLGWDAPRAQSVCMTGCASEPHARRAGPNVDCEGELPDRFEGRDCSPQMLNGGCIGYHGRDCAPNTNVMQDPGLITGVSIANRLLEARNEKGWSQAQLAAKAGVQQGTIGNIEAGIRKQPRDLLAIAKALGVNPEWLLNGKGPKDAAPGQLLPLRGREPELLAFFRQLDDPWQIVAMDYIAKLTEANQSTNADLARLVPQKRV